MGSNPNPIKWIYSLIMVKVINTNPRMILDMTKNINEKFKKNNN